MPHLKIDASLVVAARTLAQQIVSPVIEYAYAHTTTSIERTTLRLIGVDGVDYADVPLPNRVVEAGESLLPYGILLPFVYTMLQHHLDAQTTATALANGELSLPAADCADWSTAQVKEGA
ncbi:MAG TPA: D-ornithine 4,5-aminomutase subunit OraS, partial [Ktedonobacteraceae bacterium]